MSGQWSFDANQFAPRQGGEAHPVGTYPFVITDTKLVPTSNGRGHMFVVEFTSPTGSIVNRYNIHNENAKAVEIAHGQLSALCHVVGVFKLEGQGEAIRGARGQMKIDYQKGEEPTAEKPAGGYVEIKKVYDVNGNEPGKAPAAAPQPMGGQHSILNQPQQQNPPANGAGGWGNGAAQAQGTQNGQPPWPGPNPPVQTNQQNWQPGPSQAIPPGNPPWSQK